MRVCLSCLKLVNEYEDESSADEYPPSLAPSTANGVDSGQNQFSQQQTQETSAAGFSMAKEKKPGAVPTMVIPASRTLAGNPNRRSAILEISDLTTPQRPTSAHTNALNQFSRPLTAQSMKHIHVHHGPAHHHRHVSRSYQRWAATPIDKNNPAPFHKNQDMFGKGKKHGDIFHRDSIIDPELAPYMSDPEMSDEEPATIFSTIAPRFRDSTGKPITGSTNAGNQNEPKTVTIAASANGTPKRSRSKSRHLRNGGGSLGSTLSLSLSSTALDAAALGKTVTGSGRTRKRNASFASNVHARPVTRGRSHRLNARPASTPHSETPRLGTRLLHLGFILLTVDSSAYKRPRHKAYPRLADATPARFWYPKGRGVEGCAVPYTHQSYR